MESFYLELNGICGRTFLPKQLPKRLFSMDDGLSQNSFPSKQNFPKFFGGSKG